MLHTMNITIGYYDKNGKSAGSKWTSKHPGDSLKDRYFRSTFHATTQDGDYMSFTFNGSAVYVYGAKRSNHGSYSATIDGQTGGGLLFGYAAKPEIFQAPLFFTENLNPAKTHTVVLTNLADQTNPAPTAENPYFLDIDYVVITQPVPSDKIYTTTYDDFSPSFTYSQFQPVPNFGNGYYNSTSHLTFNTSASLAFAFNGTSVQIFGGLNVDHGNYTIVLDGGLTQVFNGSSPDLWSQQSLFLATNLTEGEHFITLTNLGGTAGNAFDFDYAVVNSTVSPDLAGNNATNTTTDSSDTVPSSEDHSKGSNFPTGIVIGVVTAVLVIALVSALILLFCIKRKKRQYRKTGTSEPRMDLNGDAYDPHHSHQFDGREVAPFQTRTSSHHARNPLDSLLNPNNGDSRGPAGVSEMGYASSELRSATFLQPGHAVGFFNAPPPPPSNATSYPLNEPDASMSLPSVREFQMESPRQLPPGATGGAYVASSAEDIDQDTPGSEKEDNLPVLPLVSTLSNHRSPPSQSLKSAGLASSFTARPGAHFGAGSTISAVTSARIYVPGREVDHGPIPQDDEDEDEQTEFAQTLPPNYQQATQPQAGQSPTPTER
ncbi:hypothetical protein BD324DRAFT_678060 [Kockovaella imperatae]|uniref:Uncharacterized protein n=1 Tax=Kockovaella imperatae TaxID=4999 RepID=A0A1Y1URL0_9TREE|nr:hypothetical protein BD324DRAFT_678060 [Kockovaella imperatae]ORX40609.1 hypothetical protein BD324DRAFT_678060 [Kockovaella imperatae]